MLVGQNACTCAFYNTAATHVRTDEKHRSNGNTHQRPQTKPDMKHKPSAKSWRASFLDAAALSIKNCLHAIKQAVAEAGHIMMVADVFHAAFDSARVDWVQICRAISTHKLYLSLTIAAGHTISSGIIYLHCIKRDYNMGWYRYILQKI